MDGDSIVLPIRKRPPEIKRIPSVEVCGRRKTGGDSKPFADLLDSVCAGAQHPFDFATKLELAMM